MPIKSETIVHAYFCSKTSHFWNKKKNCSALKRVGARQAAGWHLQPTKDLAGTVYNSEIKNFIFLIKR